MSLRRVPKWKLWLYRVERRMAELLCRHDMGLAADWTPGEICIHIVCGKCGKIYGHYHLPTIPGKTKEKLH